MKNIKNLVGIAVTGSSFVFGGCLRSPSELSTPPAKVAHPTPDLSGNLSRAAARIRDAAPKIISFDSGHSLQKEDEHVVSVLRDGRWVREKALDEGVSEPSKNGWISKEPSSGLQGAGLSVESLPGSP